MRYKVDGILFGQRGLSVYSPNGTSCTLNDTFFFTEYVNIMESLLFYIVLTWKHVLKSYTFTVRGSRIKSIPDFNVLLWYEVHIFEKPKKNGTWETVLNYYQYVQMFLSTSIHLDCAFRQNRS